MAEDLVLKILREIRADAKKSGKQTRDNFGKVFHRLAMIEAEGQEFRGETQDSFAKVDRRLGVLETQMSDVRQRLGSLAAHGSASRGDAGHQRADR